jgi:hypothetical protein
MCHRGAGTILQIAKLEIVPGLNPKKPDSHDCADYG